MTLSLCLVRRASRNEWARAAGPNQPRLGGLTTLHVMAVSILANIGLPRQWNTFMQMSLVVP